MPDCFFFHFNLPNVLNSSVKNLMTLWSNFSPGKNFAYIPLQILFSSKFAAFINFMKCFIYLCSRRLVMLWFTLAALIASFWESRGSFSRQARQMVDWEPKQTKLYFQNILLVALLCVAFCKKVVLSNMMTFFFKKEGIFKKKMKKKKKTFIEPTVGKFTEIQQQESKNCTV